VLSIYVMTLYFSDYAFQNSFIIIDKLNLIFVSIITLLSSIIALYGTYYFNEEIHHKVIGANRAKHYLILSNLFILAMIGSATFKNLVMIWVALEATTIFTTSLISFYGTKNSWEAAWKYLIIC
jgi:hydrogenase-4 component F